MSDQSNQPTILIKKADGTTERITLAELKARQSGVSIAPIVETVIPEKKEIVPPKIERPHGLVIGPAEKKSSQPSVFAQDKIVQASLKSEDVESLLVEDVPNSPHAETTTVPARTDQVSKIIAGLSFKIPPQFENRLYSGVQLRLKDIRSEADTRDLGLRSIKDGGLGLTQAQVEELVMKTKPTVSPIIDKEKLPSLSDLALLPTIEITPKNGQQAVVDKIIDQVQTVPNITDLIMSKKTESNILPSPMRPNTSSSFKPLMHDVKTKPIAMSPLDEIHYFSLVDLRRLSSSPSEAVSRLKQKFVNLRDESFLLFMDSWNAWHGSPLYQSYLDVVDSALSQKFALSTVSNTKEKISLSEIEELIKMEKELDI